MKQYRGSLNWLALGLLTLVIRWLSPASWIEQYYSRAVFPAFRTVWDTLITSWVPVPLMYLLLIFLLGIFIQATRRWWRSREGWKARLISAGMGVLGFWGAAVFFFFILWGFNYGRISVERQLDLALQPMDLNTLAKRVQDDAAQLARLRAAIPGADTSALAPGVFPADQEDLLRTALEKSLHQYGYPTSGKVRGRVLRPKGVFLRFSSAGLYFPWSGEGHIDGGLLPLQQPYTMAHELAHGYGFGDEGTCSFWAFTTHEYLSDPALKYAVRLGYWRTLAGNWLRADRAAYFAFRDTLPAGIQADLEAINRNNAAYPDLMPRFRYAAYDAYLKSQGIQEGMLNYNRVVLLVEAWRAE